MAFAFEDSNLTASHTLTKPPYIINGNARVSASMVDNDIAGNIDIAKSNRLSAFQANDEVHRRICIRGGQFPDFVRQAVVIIRQAFTFLELSHRLACCSASIFNSGPIGYLQILDLQRLEISSLLVYSVGCIALRAAGFNRS